jgi:hypothetical protein
VYLAEASVTRDSCGERLANVRQTFSVGSDRTLDTSLVTFPLTEVEGTLSGSFAEQNGGCSRVYEATLANLGDADAPVTLRFTSNCGEKSCSTEWQGTLLRRQLNIYRFALAWSGAVFIHFVVFARLRAQFINPARAHTATGI